MTDKLTPRQTLLVWCLLAKQGSAWQKDIKPEVNADDRKLLESRRLISSFKISGHGANIRLKLEDKGWRWAVEHLTDPLPVGQAALHGIMTLLSNYFAKSEASLGDIVGTAVDPAELSKPPRARPISLKSIKAAYEKASGKKSAVRVLLNDLRSQFPDVRPSDLDQAICRAHVEGKLILMRLDNPAEITEPVRNAQIDFKGTAMHLVWIEK